MFKSVRDTQFSWKLHKSYGEANKYSGQARETINTKFLSTINDELKSSRKYFSSNSLEDILKYVYGHFTNGKVENRYSIHLG